MKRNIPPELIPVMILSIALLMSACYPSQGKDNPITMEKAATSLEWNFTAERLLKGTNIRWSSNSKKTESVEDMTAKAKKPVIAAATAK